MQARTLARTLRIQFRYIAHTVRVNLAGLSDADALVRPAASGNCAHWILGHLLHARAGLLFLLAAEPPFAPDRYARFARGSAPLADAEATLSLADMAADFAAAGEPLDTALAGLTDAFLAGKAPFSPGDDPDETMGSLLAGLAFHEAYHAGQLGIMRRGAGRDGAIA